MKTLHFSHHDFCCVIFLVWTAFRIIALTPYNVCGFTLFGVKSICISIQSHLSPFAFSIILNTENRQLQLSWRHSLHLHWICVRIQGFDQRNYYLLCCFIQHYISQSCWIWYGTMSCVCMIIWTWPLLFICNITDGLMIDSSHFM